MAHIEWATFTDYTISPERSEAPWRKKARNHAPSHGDALHPSVEFSMLENYILDICASEPGVADHWKYLFRKWKSAKGFAKSWKPELFVYGTQHHDVHSRYPTYHAVDCTDVDCRSINCTREGREIFKRGGRSCHLQAHIVNQRATVRAIESAMDVVIAGHQTIGFYCDHGKHRSAATCCLFQELCVCSSSICSYRKRHYLC